MKGHEKASNFPINRKKKRICEKNSPSWPFLSLSLEFIQFFYSCFCDISSTQSLHIARKILVSFAIFARFESFWSPFLTIFLWKSRIFLNLSFLLFLRYFLRFQCFQVAGKILVTFARILFYWFFHGIFASDCLTKFSVNYFLCKNCEENLLTRSFLDIYIAFFFLLQFFTHCHAIPYKPSNKAAGEVKHYHNLVLTDPGVLGISIASAL